MVKEKILLIIEENLSGPHTDVLEIGWLIGSLLVHIPYILYTLTENFKLITFLFLILNIEFYLQLPFRHFLWHVANY